MNTLEIFPSLACCVMEWWARLFGQSSSTLTLSFPRRFDLSLPPSFGEGILKNDGGNGVGGGFGRQGSLVCQASHVIISLQVYD